MILSDFNMAYASFKSSKLRSVLTITGISIGVASIVLVHALGKGVQKTFSDATGNLNGEVVTIGSGRLFDKNSKGRISSLNIGALIGSSTLSEKDVKQLEKVDGVELVAPISILAGRAQTETLQNKNVTRVIASTESIKEVLNKKVKYGGFFSEEDSGRFAAVVGSEAAKNLFQDESPIGRILTYKDKEFVVKGVMEKFSGSSSTIGTDYNNVVIIPIETAKTINGGYIDIKELLVKISSSKKFINILPDIEQAMATNHKDEYDFSIYGPGEYASLTGQLFNYITLFVTAIAGISLFVGGVGIMNIMFVSVTERTKEIGIRKAIGATSRQIMGQFLIESIILSSIGGIVGIAVSLTLGYVIALNSSLVPSFELTAMAFSLILAVFIGTLFGVAPAIRAAKQDPIKSLRHH